MPTMIAECSGGAILVHKGSACAFVPRLAKISQQITWREGHDSVSESSRSQGEEEADRDQQDSADDINRDRTPKNQGRQ